MPDLVGNGLLPMPTKIDAKLLWDQSVLITVLHSTQQVSVYRVQGTNVKLIGSSTGLGKCDSGSAVAQDNGNVILLVSQADNVAGSSGSTSKVYAYNFPNAVPPKPPVSGGGTNDVQLREKVNLIQDYLNDASRVMEEI